MPSSTSMASTRVSATSTSSSTCRCASSAARSSGFSGPNGSGKTTSIRLMCGLLTPDSGSGTCLGYDIRHESEAIKRNVGYMTQRFSFWDDLTIRENLDFTGACLCDERPARRRRSRARGASGSPAARTSSPARFPAAGSSDWRSPLHAAPAAAPAAGRADRRCRSRMRAANSGRNCTGSPRKGSRSSSAPITWTRPSAATSSRTSLMAACSRRARRRTSSRRRG